MNASLLAVKAVSNPFVELVFFKPSKTFVNKSPLKSIEKLQQITVCEDKIKIEASPSNQDGQSESLTTRMQKHVRRHTFFIRTASVAGEQH